MSNRLNITIAGDRSSSGEDDSSDGQDSPVSEPRSHVYHDPYDDEWERLPYPDEIKPSNATSRVRASREARTRNTIQGSRSGSGRPARRRAHDRESFSRQESFSRRSRRTPSPESPESVDSAEEYTYEMPQDRRYWPPVTQGSGFPRGSSSGPSYPYAHGAGSHGPFGRPGSSQPPSDQLIRLGHHGQVGQSAYSPSMYPSYGPQFPHHPSASMSPFFQDHPGHPMHPVHHPQGPHARGRTHGSPQPVPPHGALPYGGLPMSPHELVPYSSNGYYPFRDPYAMGHEMTHPSYFGAYPPRGASPTQAESRTSPDPPPADAAKDEAIARLEKLILEERTEREAREAREAAKQAEIEKEAAEQAAKEERAAHEKQIAEEAAATAKAEAEQKASEEAAKAKQEADEAATAAAEAAAEAATAAAEAATAAATEAANAAKAEAVAAAAAEATAAAEAAAAAAEPPPPEKKKPIKFKDAIGRKFSFPFELCATWQGMEELIRQAFLHIDVIGPHVADGHYDLVGPNGDIILPQVWDTVVEPDWTIIMHMWPIPEKPKTPDPPPAAEAPPAEEAPAAEAPAEAAPEAPAPPEGAEATGDAAPVDESTVSPDDIKKITAVTKRQRQKSGDPGSFAMWMVGGHRLKSNKNIKVEKKGLK